MKSKSNNDELLDLVNEKDEVIGTVWKSEAHGDPIKIHREIAIALFNKKGETLLQRRSLNKKYDPGMWQITAAGHVGSGEIPEVTARRETLEEVGIKCDPIFVRKEFIKDFKEARFFYVYYALLKGNLGVVLNKNEVMDAKWIKPDDIDSFAKENNYKVDWKSKNFVIEILKEIMPNND